MAGTHAAAALHFLNNRNDPTGDLRHDDCCKRSFIGALIYGSVAVVTNVAQLVLGAETLGEPLSEVLQATLFCIAMDYLFAYLTFAGFSDDYDMTTLTEFLRLNMLALYSLVPVVLLLVSAPISNLIMQYGIEKEHMNYSALERVVATGMGEILLFALFMLFIMYCKKKCSTDNELPTRNNNAFSFKRLTENPDLEANVQDPHINTEPEAP